MSTLPFPFVHTYAPFNVIVTTPQLTLRGATDELLEQLVPLVREGEADADPPPYDDPMSLYDRDPERRVQRWLQGIWRGRGNVAGDIWRLNFVVVVGGQPAGMQDIIGTNFDTYGTVSTFSWLAMDFRRGGTGREMRQAALHLAFDGFNATEAASDAFVDNLGSNRISEGLGYTRNGTEWATRRGEPALLQRWRLTRQEWLAHRREDIALTGIDPCKALLQNDSQLSLSQESVGG